MAVLSPLLKPWVNTQSEAEHELVHFLLRMAYGGHLLFNRIISILRYETMNLDTEEKAHEVMASQIVFVHYVSKTEAVFVCNGIEHSLPVYFKPEANDEDS